MSIFFVIAYGSILSPLIPLGVAALQWSRMSADISSIRWVLVLAFIADILMIVLGKLHIHNLWVGDVFMFIQFTVLLYIFSRQFDQKKPFAIVYGAIVTFYLACLIFLDTEHTLVPLVGSNAVDGLVLIIVSIVFFYKLLNELKVVNIHRLPILWIAFGTLFYYSGNLFVFLAANYLVHDHPDTLNKFWILHNILNITKNIFFAIALWQSYRIVKSST